MVVVSAPVSIQYNYATYCSSQQNWARFEYFWPLPGQSGFLCIQSRGLPIRLPAPRIYCPAVCQSDADGGGVLLGRTRLP